LNEPDTTGRNDPVTGASDAASRHAIAAAADDSGAKARASAATPLPDASAAAANKALSQLAGSSSVQLTLLTLYSLPLALLLLATMTSRGYTMESSFLRVTIIVSSKYFHQLRDAFATFVVPFVTAYSATSRDPSAQGGLKAGTLFFILVGILCAAILLLGTVEANELDFIKNLNMKGTDAKDAFTLVDGLLTSYVKEVLTYVSLVLGISAMRGRT
jgi:hypothetical protein